MSSPAAMRIFRSSGQRGYLQQIRGDPRHVTARKLEREVQVRFAAEESVVKTREGAVQARPGDAIITGVAGETWRVSQAHFADKYRPRPPTAAGEPGPYWSRCYEILALRISEPFAVLLADGVSQLAGRAGDWLLDYGDGSLGVIAPDIFAMTYEIVA
jgi:hypothetical protein